MSVTFRFLFLSRPGCHLCEDAWPVVTAAARRASVELEVLDVDSDDELLATYGLRIPVVLSPDRSVVAEGLIGDERALASAMRSWSP